MDLTFQVPMQYCSLQHQTLLSPPDIFTTFCIGPASSFFLELFVTILCYSPVAYWTPSNLGGSSSSVISFCPFILFKGFSWQEYWRVLPFLPPVDHVLSELFIMTYPSYVALYSMAQSLLSYISIFARIRLWSMKGISFHYNPKEGQCQRMFALLYDCTLSTCYQVYAQNPPS